MYTIKRTTSDNSDFKNLVSLLDADLQESDGEQHAYYAQFNKINKIKNVVMCYAGDVPAACGAFKEYDAKTVEIKRMFVQPHLRKQGLATMVLNELERWANELGYDKFILETGKNRPQAVALYQKNGYTVIPNYGQYAGIENSICLKKIHTP